MAQKGHVYHFKTGFYRMNFAAFSFNFQLQLNLIIAVILGIKSANHTQHKLISFFLNLYYKCIFVSVTSLGLIGAFCRHFENLSYTKNEKKQIGSVRNIIDSLILINEYIWILVSFSIHIYIYLYSNVLSKLLKKLKLLINPDPKGKDEYFTLFLTMFSFTNCFFLIWLFVKNDCRSTLSKYCLSSYQIFFKTEILNLFCLLLIFIKQVLHSLNKIRQKVLDNKSSLRLQKKNCHLVSNGNKTCPKGLRKPLILTLKFSNEIFSYYQIPTGFFFIFNLMFFTIQGMLSASELDQSRLPVLWSSIAPSIIILYIPDMIIEKVRKEFSLILKLLRKYIGKMTRKRILKS